MLLSAVHVRFYKSFNFDYLRKFGDSATPRAWELLDGMYYPFVRVPIDEKITTVVGANESGKTHLLTAIEKGLSGQGLQRDDFCRYSRFFTVEQGHMRWPDFGFEWRGLSDPERETLSTACGVTLPTGTTEFLFFRTNKSTLTVYVPQGPEHVAHVVTDEAALYRILPHVFRLQENIGLPSSVPIRFLIDDDEPTSGIGALSRSRRVDLMDSVLSYGSWFQSKESVAQAAEKISGAFGKFTQVASEEQGADIDKSRVVAERTLAKDLIRKVTNTAPEALKELLSALRAGRDAFANSIIDKINDDLASRLNFPRWWVQDKQFRLLVSPREYDLAFTIRDRTNKEYAFGERSSGLRYFLSYYIQFLAHSHTPGRREVLVMDEPDAFLSNQGQQDLLKVFEAFANPENRDTPAIQVVYVTHSPFLIDKNHGDRIRVLEKGVGEEGTRVVRDASRNHYEPLRSAFGSFVGETTFIGNCNLVVEGPADQILLAGGASRLRAIGVPELDTIDLNHITIVPAGGASHVAYLVYLARGRDVEKPAVIVLLDSDKAGADAKTGLRRGGPRGRQVLAPEHVLQVGDLAVDDSVVPASSMGLVETEDLIPLELCARAARRYILEVCGADVALAEQVTVDAIGPHLKDREGVFSAIERLFESLGVDFHIEKVGFARSVLEEVSASSGSSARPEEGALLAQFDGNMRALFRRLHAMQRNAERELTADRVSSRVNRAKDAFVQDHPSTARREHAFLLFEDIERALDNSPEADAIRLELQRLRREFKIDEDPSKPVSDYERFKERLDRMRYAPRLATQSATLQEVAASPEALNQTTSADLRESIATAAPLVSGDRVG